MKRLTAVAGCLLVSGCGSSSSGHNGSLLDADGPVAAGLLSFNGARAGDVDGLAFPLLENRTKKPLEITGYHLGHVPHGVKVTGYEVYSVHDTKGAYYTIYRYKPADSGTPDLTKFPDYAKKPFSVPAGQDGDKFIMVKVVLSSSAIRGQASDCVVEYTQDGSAYSQDLPCDFSFVKGDGQPPAS